MNNAAGPGRTFSIGEGLILLIALSAAGYFRFVHIDTTWMSPDQSTLLSLAMDIGSGKRFPLIANQSSAGLAHPVLPVYLYAFPLALTHRVISAAYLTAFLNILSVGIGYFYARRFLGWSASLIFLALYALSPWSVHFSRLIWNPVMIPFFAMLALWLLTTSVTESPSFATRIGTAFALIGIFHSHLVSLNLLAGIGAIWLLFHRQYKFIWMAAVILLTGFSFVPYLWAQPILTLATGEPARLNLAPILIAGDLVSARGLFTANEGWETIETLLREWLWVSLVWLGIVTLWYSREAWKNSIPAPQTSRIILFFWITGPLVALIYHRHYLQHHYFLFLYPAVYLAMAALVEDLGSYLHKFLLRLPFRMQRVWPVIGRGGLILLLGALSVWGFLASRATLRQERFQTCLQEQHIRAAIEVIRENADRLQIRNLVVLSDGIDALDSTFGFIGSFLPSDLSIRFTRLRDGVLLPRAPTLYFVSGEDAYTEAILSQAGRLLAMLDVSPCGKWKFYMTPGGLSFVSEASGPIGAWENSLQLWKYQVEKANRGESLMLITFWKVDTDHPLSWDHFFFHLVSEQEQVISQVDGPGVSSPYWREGDWLILFTPLPLPADTPTGSYKVYCGLYSWPNLKRIPVITGPATDNRLYLTEVRLP